MDCKLVVFSGHAVQRMFERGIGRDGVLAVIADGETIAEYRDDTPFPSRLLLGVANSKPLHVVLASDEQAQRCIVVTVYEPASEHWSEDFRTRKIK
ncbi:MAG: DUF4258 domain-containing protein [Acidobacteriota bacterium]|nr:DUF4258 domain-containing protein [Acidobacteriota bacterium]